MKKKISQNDIDKIIYDKYNQPKDIKTKFDLLLYGESRHIFEFLLNRFGSMLILVFDENGIIIHANKPVTDVTGFSIDGMDYFEVSRISGTDGEKVVEHRKEAFFEALKTREETSFSDYNRGHSFYGTFSPLFDKNSGEFICVIGYGKIIDEEIRELIQHENRTCEANYNKLSEGQKNALDQLVLHTTLEGIRENFKDLRDFHDNHLLPDVKKSIKQKLGYYFVAIINQYYRKINKGKLSMEDIRNILIYRARELHKK